MRVASALFALASLALASAQTTSQAAAAAPAATSAVAPQQTDSVGSPVAMPAPVAAPADPTGAAAPPAAPAAAATPAAAGSATTPAAPVTAAVTCGVAQQWSYATDAATLAQSVPSGCTQFLGSLSISGAAITSLAGLASLQSIVLDLDIHGTSLNNLNGLSGLTSVGGHLFVHDNPSLASLDGVSALASVTGGVLIYQNPVQTSISALNTLTHINSAMSPLYPYGVSVFGMPQLASLDGLQNLVTMGNSIDLHNNTVLSSLAKFPTTGSHVVSSLRVDNMPALTSLAPLSIFASPAAGTVLSVQGLDGVASLAGLSLAQLGNVTIAHNPALSDITAISSVPVTTGSTVVISDNSKLCAVGTIGTVAGAQVSKCGEAQQSTGATVTGAAGGNGSASATPTPLTIKNGASAQAYSAPLAVAAAAIAFVFA
ncbi:hypothetical protein HKX48_002944 [Thoreauomyces humboldtii]|nr:hypothetical protein HKX48_002944 [Thoreauomyces humboldtii]